MKIKLSKSLKIVGYYFFFALLWILFSDEILYKMKLDADLWKSYESYKGLIFVFLSSILLFNLIENSYSKIKNLDIQLHNSFSKLKYNQLEMKEMNKTIDKLFNISLKMLGANKYSDKVFIQKIFRITSNLISKNHMGSAFVIKKGNLNFIDSIGFNLNELNEMLTDINLYDFSSESIIVNRDCENIIMKKLNNKNSTLKDVKESVYVGIYVKKNIIGGFSFDISKESNEFFTDESLYKIQMIQKLSNEFYKLKQINDYRFEVQNDVVQSFITALEFHDDYTKGHSEMVASYSFKIGLSLDLNKEQLDDLYWSALLHDIGKIIIPSETLNKEEKLTDIEYEVIKTHPKIGADIVKKSNSLKEISQYILYHHERWDGKGYPRGLKGNEIPLLSQIICVADCWHAMTSKRPYKKKLNEEEGIEELIKNRGTQFSPKIVDIFINEKLYLIDEDLEVNKI